jgi:hypothetical protein
MVLLGYEAQLEARFGLCGDSANLDAREVHGCAERTIGSKIVLDATNGTPHDVDQVRSHFGPFGGKVGARFVPNVT